MKFLQGLGDDFYSDDLVHGEIVPLGAIPIITTPGTAATKAASKLPKIKTPEQQRALDADMYVAAQINSEKGYANATITPFQVKEGLIAKFKLRDIPAAILAKDVPEIGALLEILKYAVHKSVITSAEYETLKKKTSKFGDGPNPPLTFKQWLALVDTELALPSIITPITPGQAGSDGSSESGASDDGSSDQESLSTGAMIGIGLGVVAVLGGIGFFLHKKKK